MRHICLLLGLLLPAATLAEPHWTDNSALIGDSGASYQGALSVNQAAGSLNQQINDRALAIDTQAGSQLHQSRLLDSAAHGQDTQAHIVGGAFSSGSGVLGINQSAGTGSQQINALHISIGSLPQSLDDSVLAQQHVMPVQNSGTAEERAGGRLVAIDDQAFAASKGVVQLNQSAGVGNRMANTLSIRVMD